MLQKYNFDTNMILNAADIMISDYSSLGLLFLILDKPVLYFSSDVNDFSNSRGILFNDFNFWTNNDTIDTIDEFKEKVSRELNTSNIESVRKRKNLFFGNLKDGGCSNIVDYFFDKDGNLKSNIKYTYDENYVLKQENLKLKEELDNIYNSKGYKFLEKIRKLK